MMKGHHILQVNIWGTFNNSFYSNTFNFMSKALNPHSSYKNQSQIFVKNQNNKIQFIQSTFLYINNFQKYFASMQPELQKLRQQIRAQFEEKLSILSRDKRRSEQRFHIEMNALNRERIRVQGRLREQLNFQKMKWDSEFTRLTEVLASLKIPTDDCGLCGFIDEQKNRLNWLDKQVIKSQQALKQLKTTLKDLKGQFINLKKYLEANGSQSKAIRAVEEVERKLMKKMQNMKFSQNEIKIQEGIQVVYMEGSKEVEEREYQFEQETNFKGKIKDVKQIVNPKSGRIHKFSVQNSRVEYIGKNYIFNQLLGNIPISLKPINKFQLIKCRFQNIFLGIVEAKYIQDRDSSFEKRPQSIIYDVRGGRVLMGGHKKVQGKGSIQGQVVQMIVHGKKIIWRVSQEIRAQYIDQSIPNKSIKWVPCIMMYNNGDKIKWE